MMKHHNATMKKTTQQLVMSSVRPSKEEYSAIPEEVIASIRTHNMTPDHEQLEASERLQQEVEHHSKTMNDASREEFLADLLRMINDPIIPPETKSSLLGPIVHLGATRDQITRLLKNEPSNSFEKNLQTVVENWDILQSQ